jgi:hypothetical protein
VLKDGFDIKHMIEIGSKKISDSERSYSKNVLWQGAIDYLHEK